MFAYGTPSYNQQPTTPISTIFVTRALSFNLDLLFKSWGVNPYNTAGAKKMRD